MSDLALDFILHTSQARILLCSTFLRCDIIIKQQKSRMIDSGAVRKYQTTSGNHTENSGNCLTIHIFIKKCHKVAAETD